MNIPIQVHEHEQPQVMHPRNREVAVGESVAESIAGLGAIVLAIIGLAGFLPLTFAAIATIAVGAALLFEGGAIATRLYRLARAFASNEIEISGGLGAESIAGIAAIALGILALVRVDTFILLPVAVIVLGGGLLLGSAAAARVNSIQVAGGAVPNDTAGVLARESVYVAAGTQVLVGLAAVVLGILALIGLAPIVLTLVAMLALGGSVVLSGGAIGGRLMAAFHH